MPEHIAGFDPIHMGNHQIAIRIMNYSPLKFYEYIAMARPVVVFTYADTKEILVSGKDGCLFETGQIEDLKRVPRLGYQEESRWGENGWVARERVIEKAGWQFRVREMLLGIQRRLEGRHAHPSS